VAAEERPNRVAEPVKGLLRGLDAASLSIDLLADLGGRALPLPPMMTAPDWLGVLTK
jgi:hypothetical protein